MKKIITLCAVVLALAFIVTAFTACKNKPQEETTTTTQSESVKEGFYVVIDATKAVVKKDGKDYQTLKFPLNTGMKFDLDYATKNNAFIDMNFDGEPDFYIAISSDAGVINYYCWLYNATTKEFDYSVILSALKNISIDADNHRVLSSVKVDGVDHVFSYKWVDGQLLLDTDYSDDNGGIPEDVTNVANDNAIGTDKTTSANSNKETTKNNSDNKTTTSAKKPANTTTTAPNKPQGIVVETGNPNAGWY